MSDPIGEQQAYNDLNIRTIFLIGLLSAVGLFVIITGARTLYYKWQAAEDQEKRIDIPLASVDAELQEQRAAIDRYGWNPTTKAAAIPVDVAMREYVEERAARPGDDRGADLPTVPDTAGEPRAGTGAGPMDDSPGDDPEAPEVEEPDAEEPDAEEPDAGEPDAEGAGAGTAEPDAEPVAKGGGA